MSQGSNTRGRAIPQGRVGRLARLGSIVAGVGSNMMLEAAGRLARREPIKPSELLLTPANALRITDELARLRGAAMKVGQLVSMDAGAVLPPELAAILARLRAGADPMPETQLRAVLAANWGKGWEARFASLDVRPVAAASIGQVHKAVTRDGRTLAVKVQYPGVRESINSDIDNVATLLRLSGLLPPVIDPAPLLAEARRQLHEEADYRLEAECLKAFGRLLAGDPDFVVPELVSEFSNENVLAMSFAEGVPIEAVESASQAERDRIASALFDLALREFFLFGLVQTDPNFANYRYQPASGRIVLLDFGATRAFAPHVVEKFRRLALAGLRGDWPEVRAAMVDIGILEEGHPRIFQASVLVMFDTVFKAIRKTEAFDVADNDLVDSLLEQATGFSQRREEVRAPPADVLYLQRKASGLFLLATRLKARVPLAGKRRDCLAVERQAAEG